MVINGYCTLEDFKNRIAVNLADEVSVEGIIAAASRWIDKECHRRFYTTANDETRYYTPEHTHCLVPADDIISITSLKTDDGDRTYSYAWQTTDYDLLPFNANLDSEPYTSIAITPEGDYTFPRISKGVQVVGKFGYCALSDVPDPIRQVCVLVAEKVWQRQKTAPLGVVGTNEIGMIVTPKTDPEVYRQMDHFIKRNRAIV